MNNNTIKERIIPKIIEIVVILCLFATFPTTLQSKTVNLNNDDTVLQTFSFTLKNVTLKDMIGYIEKTSDYIFFYQPSVVNVNIRINVQAKNETIAQILSKALLNTPFNYEIKGRQIVLRKSNNISPEQSKPKRTVQGVVKDEQDNPIIGASIKIKGLNSGTITNSNGTFSISASDNNTILVVSYLGYVTKEIKIGNNSHLDVTLQETSKSLDEVVVVAYGTTKKSTFTGSASVIKADKIEKIASVGFTEALQGMSAGVNVQNNEGNPGGTTRIVIRGISSMSGSSNPLYIVDGMPYDGTLQTINSSDIESMTVLKDAAASSLYGSRAANGVVIITTKSGKTSKPVINLRAGWGTSDIAVPYPTKADPKEQLLMGWEAYYNDQCYKYGKTPQVAGDYATSHVMSMYLKKTSDSNGNAIYVSPFKYINEDYVMHDGKGNPYINPNLEYVWKPSDWSAEDAVVSRKLRQDYNVDISGATPDKKVNYFFSVGYLNDKGYSGNQYFKRYSFRANISSQINKWLSMGGNLSYSYARQNVSGNQRAMVFFNSLVSPYLRNPDNTDWEYSQKTGKRMMDFGTYNSHYFGIHVLRQNGDYWNNDNDEGFNCYEINTTNANYFAEIKLPLNMKFKTSLNFTNNNNTNYLYGSAVHGSGQIKPYGITILSTGGSAAQGTTSVKSLTWNNLLTGEWTINAVHNIGAMLGQEWYSWVHNYAYCRGEGIMQLGQYEVSSTTKNFTAESTKDRYALLSYFGKIDYNYDNKYYLSFSARTDGSSRFYKNNRWGTFESFGASWRVSQEKFMQNYKWLDNLIIRGSYGMTGNDKLITRDTNGLAGSEILYGWQAVYSGDNMFNTAGLEPSSLDTKNLKWEKNKQWNIGIDFGVLNRITGTIEYYSRKSTGLLYYKALPYSSQAGSAKGYNTNLGDLKNSGFEFTVNADVFRTKDFSWTINANYSTQKNEVTYLPDGEFSFSRHSCYWLMHKGGSLYDFYLPRNAGVDPETGSMLYYIHDENGGWKTTNDFSKVKTTDYQVCGSAIPKGYGSILNSLSYKGFDFSFMWYFQLGSKMFDYQYVERTNIRGGVGNISKLIKNRWRRPGDNAKIPRQSADNYNDARKSTDFYLISDNYWRLRNITLGYTVPKIVLSRMGISSLRFYMSVDNALTLGKAASQYSDPETGVTGNNYNANSVTDLGVQSARRVYMCGIQLSF